MKASVLMSIYNETAAQIKESVNSVLSQDFSDFEVIVVLDKPERTDVEEIINQFEDSRVVLYKNDKNIGLALSMNRAASLANTDIYIRMDADDVCVPGRFRREMEVIDSGMYDFVFSNYDIINQDSILIKESKVEKDVDDSALLIKVISLDPSIIHHPTVMFTRAVFERAGGYRDFPCSQDADLWLRMAENGCRFYKVGQVYLHYRANPTSITNKRWYQQQLTCHYIFELSVQRLANGKDDYSLDNYNQYLKRFGVENEQSKEQLRNAVNILSEAALTSDRGNFIKSFLMKAKVLFTSNIYRRHVYTLLRKILLLR